MRLLDERGNNIFMAEFSKLYEQFLSGALSDHDFFVLFEKSIWIELSDTIKRILSLKEDHLRSFNDHNKKEHMISSYDRLLELANLLEKGSFVSYHNKHYPENQIVLRK